MGLRIRVSSTAPSLTGPFQVGFLLGREMCDGGERKFSATRLETVGKAVVGVFKDPKETRNRGVFGARRGGDAEAAGETAH